MLQYTDECCHGNGNNKARADVYARNTMEWMQIKTYVVTPINYL